MGRISQKLDAVAFWSWKLDVVVFQSWNSDVVAFCSQKKCLGITMSWLNCLRFSISWCFGQDQCRGMCLHGLVFLLVVKTEKTTQNYFNSRPSEAH